MKRRPLDAPPRRTLLARASLLLTLATGAALAGVACNVEPAPPNLRMQMFQVDYATRQIQSSLSNPELYGQVAENARKIAGVAADAAFDRYEKKPSYRLPADELETFRQFRSVLGQRAESLEAAALAGDAAGVTRGYAQLQMLCQTCHASFRPGL